LACQLQRHPITTFTALSVFRSHPPTILA
jgi:hypothetical protein